MKTNAQSSRILSDQELVEIIDSLVEEEKHLEAARLIRNIKDTSMVSDSHRKILNKAETIEYVRFVLFSNSNSIVLCCVALFCFVLFCYFSLLRTTSCFIL